MLALLFFVSSLDRLNQGCFEERQQEGTLSSVGSMTM